MSLKTGKNQTKVIKKPHYKCYLDHCQNDRIKFKLTNWNINRKIKHLYLINTFCHFTRNQNLLILP